MKEHADCQHLLGELNDYVDGTLSATLCMELERHLAECKNCRIVVDTLRKTVYLVHANNEPEVMPDDVRERLFRCLDLNEFLDT